MHAAAVDALRPWPGLAAYEEDASTYFKGREDEAQILARLVQATPLVTLYGRSGLGKTSLLKAGLFPLLREQGLLPVYVRVDHSANAPGVLEQIARRLEATAAQRQLQLTPRRADESLWRWLHRTDFDVATRDNWPLQPVFVLDQFEEVFSQQEGGAAHVRTTLAALADLADNRISNEVAGNREATRELNLGRQAYRMLLSFREDYLPEIRTWERDLPSVLRHYLRLEPMSAARAEVAVQAAGDAVLDADAAAAIIRFVGNLGQAGRQGPSDIEPVLLSLTCTQLNLRRGGQRIDARLVDSAGPNILQDFYRDALLDMPERVHRFVERHLIQGERARGSYARDEALAQGFVTEHELDQLTRDRRLLRIESQGTVARVELIHDRLIDVVRVARDRQEALEAAAAAGEAALEAERRRALEALAAEQAARAQAELEARHRAEEGQAAQARLAQEQAARALQAQEAEARATDQAQRLRRQSGRLRNALVAAVVMTLAAVAAAGLAWRASGEAEAARQRAEVLLSSERESREEAEKAKRQAEADRRKAEEAAKQTERLMRYGWVGDVAAGQADPRVKASQHADEALQALLGAETEFDRRRRRATRLEIWTKDVDGLKVRGALANLGFDVTERKANVKDVPTNALWLGCRANPNDLKLVALALMRAGVTLRWIGPVQVGNPNRDSALIQVGAGTAVTDLVPYSVEKVLETPFSCK